jgi:membrane fusion protein
MTNSSSRREPAPFLDSAPPPWAMRALATVLLLLFVGGVVAIFAVEVPETVTASFVLEPVRGTDPIRALHRGMVSEVRVAEAQSVGAGDVLFVLASEQVGDRVAERQNVAARLSGGRGRLGNERAMYESQRQADEQEQRRLEQRLATLDRQSALKAGQLALVKEVADRRRREYEAGVVSWLDASRPKLEVDQLEGELEQLSAEAADAKNSLSRVAFEMAARRAAFAETDRGVREELSAFQVRKDVLERDALRDGNAMAVPAPCAGTVVKLHARQAGAVVDENDLLAELVCGGDPLQAELLLPERGLALVRVGQPVKLLYDAFPYERYGVQYGTLRWLSPASTASAGGAAFRAFADLSAESVGVEGRPRAVLPGMTGRAAIIVGRRSLISYAVEPVRRLRESLAAAP